jgi:surface protein
MLNLNMVIWDTSKVTNMNRLFYDTQNFNEDVSNWNTINVTDMSYMFYYATLFNQPLEKWNTNNVIKIYRVFGEKIHTSKQRLCKSKKN